MSEGTEEPLPPIEKSIDGGAEIWAVIDAELASGRIDEEEWYRRVAAVVTPAYVGVDDPRAQSGHSGDEQRWEAARRPMLDAVDADGDFLDIGCANGYLMESVHRWAARDGYALEPYGVDISPELAALARRRLPQWADRIWVGNAASWRPPRRFDYVRTCLDYVPPGRAVDLVAHLLAVAVKRRLILGVMNEAADRPWLADDLGYPIAGRREWPKPSDPRVVRRVVWIDRNE
jgi:SAM-dependent methyltransferase